MAPDPSPPETPAPQLESRESIKEARVKDIIAARRQYRDARADAIRHQNDPSTQYDRAAANSDILGALQELICELEPLYERLQICPAYWEPAEPALAILTRPALDISDIIDPDPAYAATNGYPRVLNKAALASQPVLTLYSLRDLLALEDATVECSVTVRLDRRTGVSTETASVSMVLPRRDLERARRWCFDFMEQAGLSLDTAGDSTPEDLI